MDGDKKSKGFHFCIVTDQLPSEDKNNIKTVLYIMYIIVLGGGSAKIDTRFSPRFFGHLFLRYICILLSN